MDKILKTLGISEEFTKAVKKQKVFNKIKSNIPMREDYNFMADLLFLPTTKEGYKFLLVVVDIANNEFDIEPLKNKEANSVLTALKTIFKRPYLKMPYASIATDSGTEFMSSFHKYLYDNSIIHKRSVPYRHTQTANVESLNKQLGRAFIGYMNMKEEKSGKPYKEWTDILPMVRTKLNEFRKIPIPANPVYKMPDLSSNPKFKIGDIVFYQLNYPQDALGNKQPTANFRVGDYRWSVAVKKIVKVITMLDAPYFRYILEGMPYVSFSDMQLKKSKNKEKIQTEYIVKDIIGKKKDKKITYYLIWWKGYKKKDATYEREENLIKDGLKNMIDEYNNTNNN